MTERDQQIVKQLKKCGDIEDRINTAKYNIKTAKESLEKAKKEKPKEKELCYYKDVDIVGERRCLIISLVALILSIVCVFALILAEKREDRAREFLNDMGEPYYEWLKSWSLYSDFDELEDGWKEVQKDWKKKGINISWKEVKKTREEYYVFENGMKRTIIDKYEMKSTEQDFYILSSFVLFVAFIYFLLQKHNYSSLNKKAMLENPKIEKQNEEIKKYNNEEYPLHLQEWENRCKILKESLDTLVRKYNEEKEGLNESLNKEVDFLYSEFQIERCDEFQFLRVAKVMEKNLCTYEMALEKCEAEDEEESEIIHRRCMEMIHNEEMERQARIQTKALQNYLEEQEKEKEEREMAAWTKCHQCVHRSRCSLAMRKQSLTCSDFRHE